MEVTGKGRACIPEGLTTAQDVLVQLNKVCLKSRRKKKYSMTGPGHAYDPFIYMWKLLSYCIAS